MTTRRAPVTAAPTLDELLCTDCRTGIPAFRVDGQGRRLCHRCVKTAVQRHDRIAAVAEADRIVGEAIDEEAILERLRRYCPPRDAA